MCTYMYIYTHMFLYVHTCVYEGVLDQSSLLHCRRNSKVGV
jgi:hypothetical protein